MFARILLSQITLKDIFAMLKNSQLMHELHISVNNRVILPFREDFIFTKQTLAKISNFTVYKPLISSHARVITSLFYGFLLLMQNSVDSD